ncbi:MAG: 2-dehydropantoate 2-reductase [Amphritea sp.]
MHWHILGAGSIGLLWAAKLAKAGYPTTLILRNQEKLEQFRLHNRFGLEQDGALCYFSTEAELSSAPAPITNLLITTKAYAAENAFNSVKQRLSDTSNVLLLHNGMGPQQKLANLHPDLNIWAGSTTDGAYLESAFHVIQAGTGETRIGSLGNENRDDLYRSLKAIPGTLIHEPRIILTLWRKLAINCAINPLTAIYNCKNGALVSTPEYLEQMQRICNEVERVAQMLNIPLFPVPLIEQAIQVANLTAENNSSMQQDIQHGRPTEIETITGFLCDQAKQINIEAPVNNQLLTRIRQLSADR